MRQCSTTCRISLTLLLLGLLALRGPWAFRAHAADPQPYDVQIRPSGDSKVDSTIRESSTLISLKDKTPVGGFALTQRARDDAARFETVLRSFGYYDATVGITIDGHPLSDPSLIDVIDKAPASPPVPVTVTIQPGPRFHLGTITIQGPLPPGLKPDLGIRSGQDARAEDVLAARDKLLSALREDSYPLATVAMPPAVLHPEQKIVDVTLVANPGPRAAIGPIRFEGLRNVSMTFMRRRFLLRPGEPFKPSELEKAREDLLATGVFSSVSIQPAQGLNTQGELPLDVQVEERKRHAVDIGGSYSTDLGVGLDFGWHDRDLTGMADQLNLTASAQFGGNGTRAPGGKIGAQYIRPDFLRRDQSLEISVSAIRQSLIAYEQTALIERVGLTRKLSEHWSLQGSVLAEEESITQEKVTRPYEFVGLPIVLKYDSTDSLLDPTHGMRAAFSETPTWSFVHPGGFYLISQVSGSGYLNLSGDGRSVLAMRGLVAQISGASVFAVPPDQRLYAGGSATVRGYRYQSIGPKFPDGKPTGATAVSAASIEYRQRFLEHWGAVTFVDVGQASADGAPFTSQWRAAAGIGARYYTVIGPIRLDVAVPLTRHRGDDTFELYIGLGQAF